MINKNNTKNEPLKEKTGKLDTPKKESTKETTKEPAKDPIPKPNEKIEFQILDINPYHEIDGDDEERYVMQMFGRTMDDKDVVLRISGYTPFFYINIPDNWTQKNADKLVEVLKKRIQWSCENNPNLERDLSTSLIKHCIVQKHKFYNFTNKKLFKYLMLVFKSHSGMREYANLLARPIKVHGLAKDPMIFQRYESNLEPHLRFLHIQNLVSCGWVSIDPSKVKSIPEYSKCDYSFRINWKDVMPAENHDRIAPFKIMGYDIECISADHNFPQADRKTDKVVQIGMTMYRYGSLTCYEQHLLTLKQCPNIKGANVECYKTEKGLIRGWAKKISEIRPDFKIGYNIMGFDDKYIFDRINRIDREEAERQGVDIAVLENKFIDEILMIMGKVDNKYIMETEGLRKSLTYFEIKNLSSSALGDNELKFFNVNGIITVDMMKVIMRDHRLVGYKLDNVSANFITEKTTKIVEGEATADGRMNVSIYTRSTKALEKDSYIQIMVDDGYSSTPLSEGAKYKVFDIETITEDKFNEKEGKEETISYQCIKTTINLKEVTELREILLNPLLKVFWTFAKDDMHHTLINKCFKENDAKGIRQVGIYCLKDCKLANLLMAKLEIIVNSVGMANVCNVPLSYLFLRGQGIKIFSLTAKKCREKNYLIPVLRKKKKDNNGDDDETYEGATVITPKPAVYLSPISVLDYSSLYPNSMRERNLSQECYVNDSKYDNLPEYIYHDVYIVVKDKKGKIMRNIDGTPQKEHHRFAQEVVSEQQVQIEMKHVFEKIEAESKINLDKLAGQKYYTDANRKLLIDKTEEDLEKLIEETENKEISAKAKVKIIEKAKIDAKNSICHLTEIDDKIKVVKKAHVDKLRAIISKKLSADDKKTEIAKIDAELKSSIQEIAESIEISDSDREKLINNEKNTAKKKISDERAKKFNTVNGQTVRYGILPEILTELLNKRKETNARLGREKDPFVKAILNALQLAYKVTANSLYGQTGAPTSPIFFIAIAASTTAIGRERLHYAKNIVEENFEGAEVIYGDSVTADTPLVLRDSNGKIHIMSIAELGNKWHAYEEFKPHDSNRREKQQSIVNYQIWTANGWAKIRRVIRHKTQKKIYRVSTNTGCVDVTEDHSLLDKNGAIIKPLDVKVGTGLLHGFMIQDKDESMKPAGIFAKIAEMGAIHKIHQEFQDFPNLNFQYIDPLNKNRNIREKYLQEFLETSALYGSQTNPIITRTKTDAQKLYYLLKSIGYNITIEYDAGFYHLAYGHDEIKNADVVKNIKYIRDTESDEYVYDLETEDGTFHAGIGEIIVKNTDSIFINFHVRDENGNERTDKEALIKSIKLAKRAAALINSKVPKPQGIVYEKTLHPFILVAKKKYVGLLYETDPTSYYLKSMGIVLKRRDNAPIVKIVVGGIIDHILKNRDIDKAVKYTRDVIRKLMDGKYPIDKFIISKTLKAKYKKPMTIAHKVLADRMAERDPGNKPQVNDRIPFVYVVTDLGKKKKKDVLQGDLIEHPDFVIKNGLKIDYLYYLEHQIINPASQVLELMMPAKDVAKLFDKFIVEENNKRMGRQSMAKWMDNYQEKEDDEKPKKPTVKVERDESYKKLPRIGNTRKFENQNMQKWMPVEEHAKTNSDEWKPSL